MVDHRPVQRRAIRVVRAVQLGSLVGVEELDQTTLVAPHERQGPLREGLVGTARKHARQELSAQFEENLEPLAPAYPASGYLSVHLSPADVACKASLMPAILEPASTLRGNPREPDGEHQYTRDLLGARRGRVFVCSRASGSLGLPLSVEAGSRIAGMRLALQATSAGDRCTDK